MTNKTFLEGNLNSTAILIFANSAEAEVRHKNTIASADLFHTLTSHTIQIVKKSGLPFFHFTEKEQKGGTFGERFSNAIQTVYDEGFENVITIGNDSPHLKAHHLIEVNRQLNLGKTVLGPTSDGGFYLMGLHRSNFDPQLFVGLPWQRFGLFRKISQLFESYGSSLFKLPVLHDIDTQEDIAQFLNSSKQIPLSILGILRALKKRTAQFVVLNIGDPKTYFASLQNNKGSPFLSHFPRCYQ